VPATLEGSIRAYARHVDTVARRVESTELSALLAEREGIRADLLAGAPLNDVLRRHLRDADTRLLSHADVLARNFPGLDIAAVVHDVIGNAEPGRAPAERTV
jgi:hypothetical protein